ncbi:MAG: hypothetical protein AB1638_10305 [Nitrospirota bacterium]
MSRKIISSFTSSLTVIFLLTLFLFGCERQKSSIADKPLPKEAFKAEISIKNPPSVLKIKSSAKVNVKIKNVSTHTWPARGQPDKTYQINLSYRWLDKEGKILIRDGLRTPLPYDIKPDNDIDLNATVAAPGNPGEYMLEFDMVQERVSWFKDRGSKTATVPVRVE